MLLEVSLLPSLIWIWGVYLSPWDSYSPLYHVGEEDYNAYYLAQLKGDFIKSCLEMKGNLQRIWMDFARREGAQKRSIMNLRNGLRPFCELGRLFDLFNRRHHIR